MHKAISDLRPTLKQPPPRAQPQRLVIFGASGSTGQVLVREALRRGHQVTAFGRSPSKLDIQHPNFRFEQGDVLDADAVDRAVKGQDAVMCTLGAPLLDTSGVRTQGTRNFVQAMQRHGVRRLVCMTVLGMAESWDNLPWHYKHIVVPFILGRAYVDHRGQEKVIKDSDLNWTLVRPPNLTDGDADAKFKHGFADDERRLSLKISRGALAGFMLDQLGDATYVRACPGISH